MSGFNLNISNITDDVLEQMKTLYHVLDILSKDNCEEDIDFEELFADKSPIGLLIQSMFEETGDEDYPYQLNITKGADLIKKLGVGPLAQSIFALDALKNSILDKDSKSLALRNDIVDYLIKERGACLEFAFPEGKAIEDRHTEWQVKISKDESSISRVRFIEDKEFDKPMEVVFKSK